MLNKNIIVNWIVICSLLLTITFAACSQKVAFQKSAVVPAASVNLDVDQDKNGNYKVDLKVENLAQPQQLTPARTTYVVWIESQQGSYNIGRLSVNDKLKGSLEGSSPYKPMRVKIIAEDDAMATSPGEQVVLTSDEIRFK